MFGPPEEKGKTFQWDENGNSTTRSAWDLVEFLRILENGFGEISLREILKK